ncbi:hypothetical protein FQA39_LY12072 [Lamprigera yunnana]|nr:hypothetical protein FQA39_LY12072 [Lamprigera yunnana]
MSWSHEEVICLIEDYRKWLNLYKVKSVNYKNRNLRKTALESIENSLKKSKPNITSTEIQNKFQSLKQNALKEYKKWKNSYKSGAGEDKVYEPSLWYFQIISFVIADNVPRESQDTLDGTENTETQIQEFDSIMDPSINEHESEYEEVYSGIVSPDGSVSLGVPFASNNEKRSHSAMSVPDDSQFLQAVSGTLNNINKQLTVSSPPQHIKTSIESFGDYIVGKLERINNDEVRDEVIVAIVNKTLRKCKELNI